MIYDKYLFINKIVLFKIESFSVYDIFLSIHLLYIHTYLYMYIHTQYIVYVLYKMYIGIIYFYIYIHVYVYI